jgi:hypothetical protein
VTVGLLQKIVCLNTAFCEIFMVEDECNCAHFRLLCLYSDLVSIYMCLMSILDGVTVALVAAVALVSSGAAVEAAAAMAAVALVVVHPVQLMVVVFVIV